MINGRVEQQSFSFVHLMAATEFSLVFGYSWAHTVVKHAGPLRCCCYNVWFIKKKKRWTVKHMQAGRHILFPLSGSASQSSVKLLAWFICSYCIGICIWSSSCLVHCVRKWVQGDQTAFPSLLLQTADSWQTWPTLYQGLQPQVLSKPYIDLRISLNTTSTVLWVPGKKCCSFILPTHSRTISTLSNL